MVQDVDLDIWSKGLAYLQVYEIMINKLSSNSFLFFKPCFLFYLVLVLLFFSLFQYTPFVTIIIITCSNITIIISNIIINIIALLVDDWYYNIGVVVYLTYTPIPLYR